MSKISINRNIFNLILFKIIKISLNKTKKLILILNFVSDNGIGDEGVAKLGEGLSKLEFLTYLRLDIG